MSAVLAQGGRFVLVGVLLLLMDAGIYAVAIAAGMDNAVANPLSRAVAAAMGFAAHRRFTFSADATSITDAAQSLLRYALVWVGLTVLSTSALGSISAALSPAAAVLAKPLLEAVLALISFLLLKAWVYQR